MQASSAAPRGGFPGVRVGCGEIHALRSGDGEHGRSLRCAKLYLLKFSAAVFRRDLRREARAPGAQSIAIGNDCVTVFEGDLERLAGFGALVEQVEAWFPFVGRNPFADGLPRWLDSFEGLNVERWGRWWRDVDDPFPKNVEPEEEFDFPNGRRCPRLSWCPGSRALERVGAPDAEDGVAPWPAHRAGEGEELFVPAIGAIEAGEAGGDGIGTQGSKGAVVVPLVAGEEIIPGVIDDLPEGRGARTGQWEHASGQPGRLTGVS